MPAAADLFDARRDAGRLGDRPQVRRGGMFIDLPSWRGIDINQDLLPGDVLRTNASGHLAVLFADHTQIRLGRNTTLLVKQVGAAEDTCSGSKPERSGRAPSAAARA